MENLKSLVTAAVNKSSEAAECFYQQKLNEGNMAMNEVINMISSCIDELAAQSEGFSTEQFLTNMSEALKAMTAGDYVLLADILSYDIKEQLEAAAEQL